MGKDWLRSIFIIMLKVVLKTVIILSVLGVVLWLCALSISSRWEHGRGPYLKRYDLRHVFPNNSESFTDRIAFVIGGQLYVVNAGQVEMVREIDSVYGVAWSPDGGALLVSLKQSGSNPLYDLVMISGSDWSNREYVQQDIVDTTWYPGMDWSPDGERIVYTGMPSDTFYSIYDPEPGREMHLGVGGVYIIDRSGTNRRLIARCGDCCSAAWSPDGRYTAFITEAGVEIVEPDHPESRRLVHIFSERMNTSCYGKNASWFPDSRRLLISDGSRIQVLNISDGSVSMLFELNPLTTQGFLWAMVLPDGEHIACLIDYKELPCNAGLRCVHKKLMLANLNDMIWRDITPDIQDEFWLYYLDWWQPHR